MFAILKKKLRPIKLLIKKIILVIKETIVSPCGYLPIQNKVVFVNFYGRGLGDDPKYILLELLKRNVNTEFIWISKDCMEPVPDGVKVVKYKTIEAHYHWYTARVWVDNCKNTYRPKKRIGQFYLQTWHATLSLKKVEQSVESLLRPQYVEQSIADSKEIDLMYSNNNVYFEMYKNSFWYDGPVLKCDVPREAPLLGENIIEIKNKVHRYYNIDSSKKIIIYAPTFRAKDNMELYKWNYLRVIESIEKKFNSKFVFLLRLHPNRSQFSGNFLNSETIVNATNYPDMQELISASDIMINDYSSSQFEFIMMKKPVFLYCPDIANYRQSDRPWVFEPEELPYSIATTTDELVDNINRFNQKQYEDCISRFLNQIGFEDNGNGDKVVADIVIKHLTSQD